MFSIRRINTVFFVSFLFISICLSACFGQVTPPEEYLGYKPGADFHLATYEQAMEYFDLLASETGRMQMFDMGPTSEGRRMRYAVISSEENMVNLDRYKEITHRLSLVRDVSQSEAEQLADEGKAVVWISGGLHATEVAPPMHHFQLAYDLITGEDRQTRLIRENVILLLVFANPDGMTLVADWYMKNLGTVYETSSLPVLYHKYAGHDNNRDSFMANLLETQNINRVTKQEWFPEIFYDQHQSAPFPARIWIPPGPEPVNPNKHPLIVRMKNLIGAAMGHALDEAGQPGAISRISFDVWYPGYVDGPSIEGHNVPTILTETALYRYATPHYYTLNDFPESHRDLTMGVFYPSPWQGGWWRLGDAVAYNLTASKSVLEIAAKYRREFLYNKYRIGTDVIERFENEPPYGWIISADQNDPNTTALMFNRLMNNGLEVYTADETFIHDGISYPAGSYIIPTSQPFGLFVKNLFEKQNYPDLRKYSHLWQGLSSPVQWDGPPLRPYDGVGWTLPMQMGVDSREMSATLKVSTTLITEAVPPPGTITESGSHYVFSHSDNNSFTALNRILEAGGKISWALDDFILGGKRYPKGTFVVEAGSITSNTLSVIASETLIPMRGGTVRVESRQLQEPRIALYKSWVANMDAGWCTLIFEQYGFPYYLLTDAEVKAGNLRERFDVIILPDQGANSIINGHRKGTMPPDYVGGITQDGVNNLKVFVEAGGTLICNKSSTDLAINSFRLPVRNVLRGVSRNDFNCPGSILKMDYDTGHPLAFGMPEEGIAFFSGGRVFEILPDTLKTSENESEKQPPQVVARYPDESLLLSGWMIGEEKIRGKAAILNVSIGEGKVVLFGFNVHNRAQAYLTFKLLFNAMYY